MLVGGEPFLGEGFYISVDTPAANESLADSALWRLLDRQAVTGDNQMMAYFFPGLSHAHRLEFLDYSEKLGLKVMIPLSVDVPYTAYAGDPAKHAWFVSNITSYMNHTAVVSPVPFVRSCCSRTCTDEPPFNSTGAASAAGLVHL